MIYIIIVALIVFLIVRNKNSAKANVNSDAKLGSTTSASQSINIDKKAKNSDVEQEIIQKMAYSELLDWLIDALENKQESEWMKVGQYGDSGWRKVIVKPSGFIIEVPGAYQHRDENNFVAINFESAGYTQITAHSNKDGKTNISRSRMCYLYAAAIQMRLQAAMCNCEFGKINNDRDLNELDDDNVLFALDLLADRGCKAEFSYRVPVPTASSLF